MTGLEPAGLRLGKPTLFQLSYICIWHQGKLLALLSGLLPVVFSLFPLRMERVERIELSSEDWKSPIISHYTILAFEVFVFLVCFFIYHSMLSECMQVFVVFF